MQRSVVLQSGHGRIHSLPPHRNPGLEVVLILAGRLDWQVEGKYHPLAPGEVFFTLPWQTHGSIHPREPGHEWVYVILGAKGRSPGQFHLPFLKTETPESRRLEARFVHPSRQSLPGSPLIRELLMALHATTREETSAPGARQGALAAALLHEMARQMDLAPPPPPVTPAPLHGLVARMKEDLDRPWSLAEMAAFCHLGRTRFEYLFHREFGDTPVAHLNRLRIEEAARRLRTGRGSVTEIALSCGFSSSQYFARIFRRHMKSTPGEYRRHTPAVT